MALKIFTFIVFLFLIVYLIVFYDDYEKTRINIFLGGFVVLLLAIVLPQAIIGLITLLTGG